MPATEVRQMKWKKFKRIFNRRWRIKLGIFGRGNFLVSDVSTLIEYLTTDPKTLPANSTSYMM